MSLNAYIDKPYTSILANFMNRYYTDKHCTSIVACFMSRCRTSGFACMHDKLLHLSLCTNTRTNILPFLYAYMKKYYTFIFVCLQEYITFRITQQCLHANRNKYYTIVFVCLYALMNLNYDKYNTSVSVCIILTNIAQISWHSYMNKYYTSV